MKIIHFLSKVIAGEITLCFQFIYLLISIDSHWYKTCDFDSLSVTNPVLCQVKDSGSGLKLDLRLLLCEYKSCCIGLIPYHFLIHTNSPTEGKVHTVTVWAIMLSLPHSLPFSSSSFFMSRLHLIFYTSHTETFTHQASQCCNFDLFSLHLQQKTR